jgi:replicative DNA helicase
LIRVAEKIIAEEGGETLRKCIVELEEEHFWLKATATKIQGSVDSSAETIATLQQSMVAMIEDYDMLMEGNKSLLAERNALHECSKDLVSELTKAHASATEDIVALEARVRSAKANVGAHKTLISCANILSKYTK